MAETGQPYAFTRDDPLNLTDPLGLAPQPKTLSKQEQELLNESSNGRNFKDGKALTPAQRRAWNQANQKQIYNEKVAEQARNKQKRQSNASNVPAPHSPSIWDYLGAGALGIVAVGSCVAGQIEICAPAAGAAGGLAGAG